MYEICSTRCALNSHRAKTFAVKSKVFVTWHTKILIHVYLHQVATRTAKLKNLKMNIFDTIFASRVVYKWDLIEYFVSNQLMPSLQTHIFVGNSQLNYSTAISTVFVCMKSHFHCMLLMMTVNCDCDVFFLFMILCACIYLPPKILWTVNTLIE